MQAKHRWGTRKTARPHLILLFAGHFTERKMKRSLIPITLMSHACSTPCGLTAKELNDTFPSAAFFFFKCVILCVKKYCLLLSMWSRPGVCCISWSSSSVLMKTKRLLIWVSLEMNVKAKNRGEKCHRIVLATTVVTRGVMADCFNLPLQQVNPLLRLLLAFRIKTLNCLNLNKLHH